MSACPCRPLHSIKLCCICLYSKIKYITTYSSEKPNKTENAAMQWPESDASHCICIVKSTKIDLVSLYMFIIFFLHFFFNVIYCAGLGVQFHKKMRPAKRLGARLLSHRESLSHEMHQLCTPIRRERCFSKKKEEEKMQIIHKPDV